MEIKNVSIIGLGALGILFGNMLSKKMPKKNLRIIADRERITRYQDEGIYCNGERCDFNYVTPEAHCEPADLLIFSVKFTGLEEAVADVKNHVGPGTVIISLLNGISSESVIGAGYGNEKILYCVAQGMDAVKSRNKLTYHNTGMLCFGEPQPGVISSRVDDIAGFFDGTGIPYEIRTDMSKHMWGKFMLNVGVNQTAAVYGCNYGGLQKEGPLRDIMILAMREAILLSVKEGVNLTEKDLEYWIGVMAPLNPDGKPSMQQDTESRRKSEVGLFAGAILSLGKKHGVPTPVNQMLYDRISAIENAF